MCYDFLPPGIGGHYLFRVEATQVPREWDLLSCRWLRRLGLNEGTSIHENNLKSLSARSAC